MSEFFDEYGNAIDEFGASEPTIDLDDLGQYIDQTLDAQVTSRLAPYDAAFQPPVQSPPEFEPGLVTPEQYVAAASNLAQVAGMLESSPGASQYQAETIAAGQELVLDRVERLAGGKVQDRLASIQHAEELYDAGIRRGDTPEAAMDFAFQQVSKKARSQNTPTKPGQRTLYDYSDVADEFARRSHGKTIVSAPKRDR